MVLDIAVVSGLEVLHLSDVCCVSVRTDRANRVVLSVRDPFRTRSFTQQLIIQQQCTSKLYKNKNEYRTDKER